MLLSPTASLWFFNHGDVFTAVPLFYPVLLWVVIRGIWIGVTGRGSPSRPRGRRGSCSRRRSSSMGFRVGLNVRESNVIDVGYSGVIGGEADRERAGAVGQLPRRGQPEGLRSRRRGR